MFSSFARLADWDGGLTLLPPLVAILCAMLTRRVVPSLGAAVLVGGVVVTQGDLLGAVPVVLAEVVAVITSVDNALITAFSLLVAATVGIMSRTGGTRALVAQVERMAKGRRGAMVSSWLAGAAVFFDDYANCLVVGSSMGPVCDRYGVSRAKLAYIVDATAAPLASVALVSTWVGYEVGLIASELQGAGSSLAPFTLFVEALPYRFYCLLTLVFVGAVAITGRDYGPMAAEEARARPVRAEGEGHEGPVPPLYMGVLPVATLVLGVFALLFGHGLSNLGDDASGAALFEVLDAANPFLDMAGGALLAWLVAAGLGLTVAGTSARELATGSLSAMRAVAKALAVLYLAWTLGGLIKQTDAAPFVATMLQGTVPAELLPLLTFVLAGLTAFATGSSYFTMGALLPLVMPLALQIDPDGGAILLASMAAVLDGAVLGDHVSPISDTTILSSLGSGVDLVTHVRTQMPYALTAGVIAALLCTLPAGYGITPWLLVPLGAAACVGAVLVLGRPLQREQGLGSQ
jgi:Na+/H+ antiporter NhaC